jgi:phage I-like protein
VKGKDHSTTGVAHLSGLIDVVLLPDGTPPREFRMFRAGVNESDYGPITVDEKALAELIAADQEKGNPLYFDWNHGMAKPFATREEGASAGTFKLEARNGELWVVDCQYTADGFEDLKSRRYNLFSPAFAWRTEGGVKRPTRVINCAFVNLAGLNDLNPIAASARLTSGDDPMDEKLKELQDKLTAATAEIATLKAEAASRGVLTLGAVVGVAGGEPEIRTAITGLVAARREILLLTAKDTDAGAMGVIQAWKASHEKVATLSAQLDGIAQAGRNTEFKATLDKLVTEKKVTPAFRKDFWEAKHAPGGNVTEAGLEMLRGFAGSDPAAASGGEITQPTTGVLSLGGDIGKMNKLMNVDPAAFAKWQAEKAAAAAHGQ